MITTPFTRALTWVIVLMTITLTLVPYTISTIQLLVHNVVPRLQWWEWAPIILLCWTIMFVPVLCVYYKIEKTKEKGK